MFFKNGGIGESIGSIHFSYLGKSAMLFDKPIIVLHTLTLSKLGW